MICINSSIVHQTRCLMFQQRSDLRYVLIMHDPLFSTACSYLLQTLTNVPQMFTTVISMRLVQTRLGRLHAHAFKVIKEMVQTVLVRKLF